MQEEACANLRQILPRVISAGADVNFVNPESEMTPLGIAAERIRSGEIIQALLSSGADPDQECRHFDPILAAALHMNMGTLQYLVKHASRYPKTNHWSEYLNSVSPENPDEFGIICECLEKAGVLDRVNDNGQTLLHLAAQTGNCPLITSLLSHRASLEVIDHRGWLAVHYAGFSQNTDAVQCLLPTNTSMENMLRQRDILNMRSESGKTMFHVAVESNIIPMVVHLLKVGADTDSGFEDSDNNIPPLCYAALRGYEKIVSVLLSHGANVEVADSYGWRPLHLASYMGRTVIVQALIDAGASVRIATREWSSMFERQGIHGGDKWAGQPLHLAAMEGHVEIVRLLLDHGADVHASTGHPTELAPIDGPTALHIVLENAKSRGEWQAGPERRREAQIVQMLVDKGELEDNFTLEDISKFFEKLPDIWNVLRAAILERNDC